MRYPNYLGILQILLFIAMMHTAAGSHLVDDSNLTVDCGSLSGNVTLDCIHKVPEILPSFLDNVTVFGSDEIAFDQIGGLVSNACNPVIITVEDVLTEDASDCQADKTLVRTYTISDQVTQIECTTTYLIEYKPLQLFSVPPDLIIDCEENVDSILNAWTLDIGGLSYQGCANIRSTLPANPIVAFDSECKNDNPSLPNQRGNIRLQWFLEDDCGEAKTTIAGFIVVDNAPPELDCPNTREFDIEDPDLFDKIRDHLDNATAIEQCGEARISNDFNNSFVNFDCLPEQDIFVSTSAIDTCQNISNCITIIKVTNDAVPVITCPQDITVECGDPNNQAILNNWRVDAQSLDFTGMAISVEWNFDVSLLTAPFCGQTTEITFTAEYCGRTASCFGNVTFIDTQKPIITCPNDTIYFTSEPDIVGAVTDWRSGFVAVDQCGMTTPSDDLDINEVLFSCEQLKEIFVEFRAEDSCQNDTSCVRRITIESDYSASITCSSFLQLECGATNNQMLIEEWITEFTGTDVLNNDLDVSNDLDLNDPRLMTCSGNISVRFISTDLCGGELSCPSFIMMVDTEDPTIGCPPSITFDSGTLDLDTEIGNWLSSPSISDNCGIPILTDDFDPSSIQGCDLSVTVDVLFTVTDSCGLSADCTSALTLDTDRLPSIICAPNLQVDCNDSNNPNKINTWLLETTGQDFSGNDLVVNNDYTTGGLDFAQCLDSIEVKFEIEDNCLYRDSCTAMIIVADTISPTITCPTMLSINSSQDDYAVIVDNWLSLTTSADGCMPGGHMTTFDTTQLDICNVTDEIVVTYLATDGCNNTSTCEAIISINNELPTIICPVNDLQLQCGDPTNEASILAWLSETSATDNNNATLTIDEDYDPNNLLGDCNINSIITFKASDTCGKENTCSKTISLVDNIGPDIDCPSELNLSAGDPDIVTTVEDYISNILITDCNSYTRTDDLDRSLLDFMCDDELVIPVTIMAIDSCDNDSNCSFDITIRNSVVSSINCAQDTIIECGNPDNDIDIQRWLDTSTAFDTEGNGFVVTNDFFSSGFDLEQCGESFTVEFVMMDNCNSTLTCTSSLRVEDTTIPEIICPKDTAFVFGTPTFDDDINTYLSLASGSDNCGGVSITPVYNSNYVIDDCLGFVDVPVTFTVMDDCSYSNNCESILTVRSERAPIINCPQDLVLECGGADNITTINAWRLAADGFDFDMTELDVTSPGYNDSDFMALTCGDTLLVTFVMTNSCNIDITCDALILLEDNTPPQLVCQDDISVSTTDVGAPADIDAWLLTAMTMDNCSMTALEYDLAIDFTDLCSLPELIEVPYTSTDECGLSSNCTALIFLNKDAPTITCPSSNLILECGDISNNTAIGTWLDEATAIDNNGMIVDVTDDFGNLNMNNICESTTTVTFSVLDNCGQTNDCSVDIVVTDTQSPSITCPNDIDIDIFSPGIATQVDTWLQTVAGEDACSNIMIEDNLVVNVNSLSCGESYDVTFSIEDECNNLNDCMANIIFTNNLTVSIDCPEPIIIKCSEVNTTNNISLFLSDYIVESQDSFVVTTDFDIDNFSDGCTESFSEVITFTIVDNCANTDDCETSITFLPDGEIYIPNIFSPNGDGDNDWFTVYGNESISNVKSLLIYSRWGDLVFEATDFPPNEEEMGWDGFYRSDSGHGNVYVYVIEAEDRFGNIFNETGPITVVK